MSRGTLDKDVFMQIEQQLPDLDAIWDLVLALNPDFLSMSFPHESEVPVATVCLKDCLDTCSEVRYALIEYLAHRHYYRVQKEPPDEHAAVFFEKYYLDDAAIRMYSAAEHLAEAIRMMLELPEEEISKQKAQSQWVRVVKYLRASAPDKEIVHSFDTLSRNWKFTMRYRGKWVHNQPPTVDGAGVIYDRRRRWARTVDDSGWTLGVGAGDHPKHDTGELGTYFSAGFGELVDVVKSITESYIEILGCAGIRFSDDGGLMIDTRTLE